MAILVALPFIVLCRAGMAFVGVFEGDIRCRIEGCGFGVNAVQLKNLAHGAGGGVKGVLSAALNRGVIGNAAFPVVNGYHNFVGGEVYGGGACACACGGMGDYIFARIFIELGDNIICPSVVFVGNGNGVGFACINHGVTALNTAVYIGDINVIAANAIANLLYSFQLVYPSKVGIGDNLELNVSCLYVGICHKGVFVQIPIAVDGNYGRKASLYLCPRGIVRGCKNLHILGCQYAPLTRGEIALKLLCGNGFAVIHNHLYGNTLAPYRIAVRGGRRASLFAVGKTYTVVDIGFVKLGAVGLGCAVPFVIVGGGCGIFAYGNRRNAVGVAQKLCHIGRKLYNFRIGGRNCTA